MRATGLLRRPSGAGSGRIRLSFAHPSQKIPRLKARGGGVDRGGLQVGVAQGGAAIVGSGTPAATAAMPKPSRRPFGHAWGPSTPASAMVLAIFRWAVARDQGQRGLPSAFAGVERSAWTSSRARSSSGRTGISRQRSAPALQGPDPNQGGLEVDVGGSVADAVPVTVVTPRAPRRGIVR